MFSRRLICVTCLFPLFFQIEQAEAQRFNERSRRDESKTIVEFEILMPQFGAALKAQEWQEVFDRLDVSVRFRQAIGDDKPGIEERTRGTLRIVTVTGAMDASGSLHFDQQEYSPSDGAKLTEWIDELKTYGAQGSPEGKPVWGLTRDQFAAVYEELSRPISASVRDLKLTEALAVIEFSEDYPVRLHTSAEEHLRSAAARHPVRVDVESLSRGTGLAILLADFGLGFRPLRTPQGDIELVVQPLADVTEPWPVGWEIEASQARNKVAPKYFAMVTAGFEDLPLQDVLDAVAQASETPVVINYERALAKEIDPREVAVSFPRKRTAWALLVRDVTARAKLTRSLLIDEAGQPFVYVYPFEPKVPSK
ncbi:MAG: hypothetical protein DWQ34_24950 [Planctomycetota bacterium]|nr:MAG: hypothetical protein DWQ34_24950 [Planctomycetota bacterium]REK24437.1 MAG: hypothetical protein DWQ41_15590 [Planctomycetota bacterium]REK38626.1 MAG: hypothetical protein DWQ45_04375 [Planctomycetota bacterium]